MSQTLISKFQDEVDNLVDKYAEKSEINTILGEKGLTIGEIVGVFEFVKFNMISNSSKTDTENDNGEDIT